PSPPLFPYTTLFRSRVGVDPDAGRERPLGHDDLDELSAHVDALARRIELGRDVAARPARAEQAEAQGAHPQQWHPEAPPTVDRLDRKSTRLNSSHVK